MQGNLRLVSHYIGFGKRLVLLLNPIFIVL